MRRALWVLLFVTAGIAAPSALAQRVTTRELVTRGDSLLSEENHAAAEGFFDLALLSSSIIPGDAALRARAHFGKAFSAQLRPRAEHDSLTVKAATDLIAHYDAAISLDSAEYFDISQNNAGVLLLDLGRPAEALERFRMAAAAQPSATFLTNLGRAHEALSHRDSAKFAYVSAQAVDSTDETSKRALYKFYEDSMEDEPLLDLIERALAARADVPSSRETLIRLLTRASPRLSADAAGRALVLLGESYALMRVDPEFFETSIERQLRRISALHGPLRRPLAELTGVFRAVPEDSIPRLTSRWWRETPRRRRPWSMMLTVVGDHYYWKGRPGLATAFYEAAISRPRGESDALGATDLTTAASLIAAYGTLEKVGRIDSLTAELDRRRLVTTFDGDLTERLRDAYLSAGNQLTDLGEYQRAKSQYRKAIALDPSSASAFVGLGVVHDGVHELDSAIAAFERAVEIDSSDAVALNNLGYTLFIRGDVQRGDLQRSLALLQQSYQRAPSLLTAVNLGLIYRFAGDVENALRWDGEAKQGADTTTNSESFFAGGIWHSDYKPLQAGGRLTVNQTVRTRTLAQKRAFIAMELAIDEAMAGRRARADALVATARELLAEPAFSCFFANEIEALLNRVTVRADGRSWLLVMRRTLTGGRLCPPR